MEGGTSHLRCEPRDSMFLRATISRAGSNVQSVKVRNLSPGGMMAECPSGFMRGDVVDVELRGLGAVPGRIAWVAAGRIGVQFDRQVDHRLARVTGPLPDQAAIKLMSPISNGIRRPAVR